MADTSTVEPDTPAAADASADALICPECSEPVKPRRGFSELAAVNAHRARVHGYVSPDKGPKQATPRRRSAPTPLRALREAAGEAGRGRSAPTADQLSKVLGKLLGYSSLLMADMLVAGDPRLSGEAEEDAMAAHLALEPDEAVGLAHPFARMAAGTSLNKRIGRPLVDNADVIDAAAAGVAVVNRMGRYLRERRAYEAAIAAGQAPPPAATVLPIRRQADPAAGPGPAPARSGASPPPTRGVVVTPDMVDQARNGHNPGAPYA